MEDKISTSKKFNKHIEDLKEYIEVLRNDSTKNRKSSWLNFIAFFVPILGIFWVFYYLLKSPIRSESLLRTVGASLILQFSFLFFSYFFLFDYLGRLCIYMFG